MGDTKKVAPGVLLNGDPVLQAIDRGVRNGIRAAILKHKRDGHPIVILRDGEVVELPASEIPDLDEEDRTPTAGD